MLKKSQIVTVGLMLAAAMSAEAAAVRTYQDALSKANERRPAVIFCYGANYDKLSAKTYESFIKKRGIATVIRDSAFLEVPMYQFPTEKQEREYKKIMGNRNLPGGIWSYPCLAVVDYDGNLRGVVQSAEEMKSPEAALEAITPMLENYEKQEKLIQKAIRASKERRMQFLREAADLPLKMPGNLAERFKSKKEEAPNFSFDVLALVEKLQVMGNEEAETHVRGLMKKGCYSRLQRQEMMAALSGHLRRNKAPAAKLRALYTEMKEIDPTSIYGHYADGAIELWGN